MPSVVRVTLLLGLCAGAVRPAGAQDLSFPVDDGPHEGTDFELWALAAHVEGASGRKLGVVTFFFAGKVSGLKLRGTYHLVADEEAQEWVGARDLVVPIFGKSSSAKGRLDMQLDRSRLTGDTATSVITSWVRTGDADLQLVFEPVVGVTDLGLIDVGRDARQRMYVRAEGVVTGRFADKDSMEELTGRGFFQHAWGDSPDPGTAGSIFSVHLEDGSALLGYHGDADFSPHGLSLSRPGMDGRVLDGFSANRTHPEGLSLGDREYPIGWQLRAGEGEIDLTLEELTGGQPVEILGTPYWVGRCRVVGVVEGRPVRGLAFVLIRGGAPS